MDSLITSPTLSYSENIVHMKLSQNAYFVKITTKIWNTILFYIKRISFIRDCSNLFLLIHILSMYRLKLSIFDPTINSGGRLRLMCINERQTSPSS